MHIGFRPRYVRIQLMRSFLPSHADNIQFSRSVLASSFAWLPLLYDTVVLGLIGYRTLPALRFKNRYSIMKRLLQDGVIYYTYAASIVDPRYSDLHVWIKGYFCGQCGSNTYGHLCASGFEIYHGAVSDFFFYYL